MDSSMWAVASKLALLAMEKTTMQASDQLTCTAGKLYSPCNVQKCVNYLNGELLS